MRFRPDLSWGIIAMIVLGAVLFFVELVQKPMSVYMFSPATATAAHPTTAPDR